MRLYTSVAATFVPFRVPFVNAGGPFNLGLVPNKTDLSIWRPTSGSVLCWTLEFFYWRTKLPQCFTEYTFVPFIEGFSIDVMNHFRKFFEQTAQLAQS